MAEEERVAPPTLEEIQALAQDLAQYSVTEGGTFPGRVARLQSLTALYVSHRAERGSRWLGFLTALLVIATGATVWLGFNVQRVSARQADAQADAVAIERANQTRSVGLRACGRYEQEIRAYAAGGAVGSLPVPLRRTLDSARARLTGQPPLGGENYAAFREWLEVVVLPRAMLDRDCPPD